MGKILSFFIFSFMVSCAPFDDYQSPEHVIAAENVTASSGRNLGLKHHMHLVGFSGSMMTCVKIIGLSFQIFRPLTQDEARELVIECALEFLDDINHNSQIQPYLVTYPFTPENVEIEIFTQNEDNTETFDPYIRMVSAEKGKVFFATKSPLKEFGYENFYVETFEEALAKTKFYQS